MFIRERSHKLKNGTKGYGYSLCQAMRINGNATSFTVLNLGADFAVPKEDWDPLSDQIENHLRKDSVDLSGFSEVTREAFHKISKELAIKDYQIDQLPDKREAVVLASTELQKLTFYRWRAFSDTGFRGAGVSSVAFETRFE